MADRQQLLTPAFMRRRATPKRVIEFDSVPFPAAGVEPRAFLKPEQAGTRPEATIGDS
jgi:hypothetical protein